MNNKDLTLTELKDMLKVCKKLQENESDPLAKVISTIVMEQVKKDIKKQLNELMEVER